ncbi:MAG: hypothetical protein PHD95_06830 [Candidatus ainarchaeum sp.]|nr:hypothetical protein [Candidatus ainarchaeum sp.]
MNFLKILNASKIPLAILLIIAIANFVFIAMNRGAGLGYLYFFGVGPLILHPITIVLLIWAGYLATKKMSGGIVTGAIAGILVSLIIGILIFLLTTIDYYILSQPFDIVDLWKASNSTLGILFTGFAGLFFYNFSLIIMLAQGFIVGAIGGAIAKAKNNDSTLHVKNANN